jgi:hypothetical protein
MKVAVSIWCIIGRRRIRETRDFVVVKTKMKGEPVDEDLDPPWLPVRLRQRCVKNPDSHVARRRRSIRRSPRLPGDK